MKIGKEAGPFTINTILRSIRIVMSIWGNLFLFPEVVLKEHASKKLLQANKSVFNNRNIVPKCKVFPQFKNKTKNITKVDLLQEETVIVSIGLFL